MVNNLTLQSRRRPILRAMAGSGFAALLLMTATVPAFAQSDRDGDGLFDNDETSVYSTNPDVADTDRDGTSDGEEVFYGSNPAVADATQRPDSDGDGLFDKDETDVYGTSPDKADTDGDNISDGQEVADGTDPKGAPAAPVPVPAPQAPAQGPSTIMLEVTGSGEVYQVWSTPFGQVAGDHTKMPLSKSYSLPADEDDVALTWTSRDDQLKGCRITVDNKVVVEKPLGTKEDCVFTR